MNTTNVFDFIASDPLTILGALVLCILGTIAVGFCATMILIKLNKPKDD